MAEEGGSEPMDTLTPVSHNGGKKESAPVPVLNAQESSLTHQLANATGETFTLNGPEGFRIKQEPDNNASITPITNTGGVNPPVSEETSASGRAVQTEGVSTSLTSTLIPPATHSTPSMTATVPSLGNGSVQPILSHPPSSVQSSPVPVCVAAAVASTPPSTTSPAVQPASVGIVSSGSEDASSVDAFLNFTPDTRSSLGARISNNAQELAKQALNSAIQQKGQDKDKIWELVSKLKRFLNNLIQMASKKGSVVKLAVESNVTKLMYNQITEENFVINLEQILNSSHQDVLLPFLKESVPYLRIFICQKQQYERYLQNAMSRQLQQQAQSSASSTGTSTQSQPSPAQVQGGGSATQLVSGVPSNGVSVKKDLTQETPTPGISLPPQVLMRMRQAQMSVAAASSSQTSPRRAQPSPQPQPQPQPQPGVRPATVAGMGDTSKSAVSLADRVKTAKMITKSGVKPNKSGGRMKGDKTGSSQNAINADYDDDDEDEFAGVDLKEESASFLPTSGAAVSSGHCQDVTLIPTDLLKSRVAGIAIRKGIAEISDDSATLLSHAVQERLREVLEKLTLICSHRMQSLKEQECLSMSSVVKEQLKFLESIDRFSAHKKQKRENDKVIKAAKSRNKDDPEVARMKEQAKMLQQEKEEEIRKRAANKTALSAILGTRKRTNPSDTPSESGSGDLPKVGEGSSGSTFGTPMGPPRQKQKRRINVKDLVFFLEQDKKSRKSLLLHKTLTK